MPCQSRNQLDNLQLNQTWKFRKVGPSRWKDRDAIPFGIGDVYRTHTAKMFINHVTMRLDCGWLKLRQRASSCPRYRSHSTNSLFSKREALANPYLSSGLTSFYSLLICFDNGNHSSEHSGSSTCPSFEIGFPTQVNNY